VRLKTQQDEVFQNEQFRMQVVGALKWVDEVVLSVDEDWSVVKSIVSIVERIKQEYGEDVKIVFGKWGDRFSGNIPEVQVCRELGIEIRDGLGEKTHNSSEYRAKAK
jgi:glycerol-3-phosphate cytidylyltransferase-like family protein